jgi:hypothetical protein
VKGAPKSLSTKSYLNSITRIKNIKGLKISIKNLVENKLLMCRDFFIMINRKASIQKLACFSRSEREKKTVSLMVNIYCRAKHKPNDVPCPDCRALLYYAEKRLMRRPFQQEKPPCNKCPVHCYYPEKKDSNTRNHAFRRTQDALAPSGAGYISFD